MEEDKGSAREIRIGERMLIAIAVLIVAALLAAVFVVPRYGKVFSAYRAARSEYTSAKADLDAAQKENEELSAGLEEKKQLVRESQDLMDESLFLAAQVEQDILDGKSSKKICYLTLDDGPYNRGKQFLELFNSYGVKATFFLTTANGDKLPDQADLSAKSMYPEYLRYGHTIGNHTYSHNYSDGGIYSSTKSFMKSVRKQQKFTEEATGGYTPEIVRFPGGTGMAGAGLESMQEALRKEGLGWVDWTVDSGDSWGSDRVSPELIRDNVLEAAKKQNIMVVLCHEWSQSTLDAMPEIIESLQAQGYIFLPLFHDSAMVQK